MCDVLPGSGIAPAWAEPRIFSGRGRGIGRAGAES